MIKTEYTCDECGWSIDNKDEIYCKSCYHKLNDKIEDLESTILKLEEDLENKKFLQS
jgi:hypothetical protein